MRIVYNYNVDRPGLLLVPRPVPALMCVWIYCVYSVYNVNRLHGLCLVVALQFPYCDDHVSSDCTGIMIDTLQ